MALKLTDSPACPRLLQQGTRPAAPLANLSIVCSTVDMHDIERSHWWPTLHTRRNGHELTAKSLERAGAVDSGLPASSEGPHRPVRSAINGSVRTMPQDVTSLPACRQCAQLDVSDPLRMRSEVNNSDTEKTANEKDHEKESVSTSLSQILGRVLNQLSVSAWLPAAMLVGNAAVLLQLRGSHSFNIALASRQLAAKPLGTIIILIFSVILATMVTQAFEFEVIRFLEGYFDSSHTLIQSFMATRIRRHENKKNRLECKLQQAEEAAFEQAKDAMRSTKAYDPDVLDLVSDKFYDQPPRVASRQATEVADELDWRDYSSSEALYKIDSINARLKSYPERNRLMPTRLGNVLRAAEDKITLRPEENIEGFVIRHADQLSPMLKAEHRDYRTRLDMYCCLMLVFFALAAMSAALLSSIKPEWGSSIAVAAYLILCYISYEAAIVSARNYGLILQEIAQRLESENELAETGVSSTFTRLRSLLHRNSM